MSQAYMRRIIVSILLCVTVISPSFAQGWKAARRAKGDTKIEVKHLKSEGYKSLDNVKLEDAVNEYLSAKYSTKNSVEVIGIGSDKDLNTAKAEARSDALYGYPEEDVLNSFFVYKKTRGRYEVVCYAALKGASAKDASKDRAQLRRRSEGTEAAIKSARADQEARAKDIKARKKAKKEARKDKKKAESARKDQR